MFKAPLETQIESGRQKKSHIHEIRVRHKQKGKLEGREKNTLQREWAEQWRGGC